MAYFAPHRRCCRSSRRAEAASSISPPCTAHSAARGCRPTPVFADADGSLGLGTGNLAFDIGVAFRDENTDDGCAGGPGDPSPALPGEFRRFSAPSLLGVAGTAPYFHDGSAATLREVVEHYANEDIFGFSESATQLEGAGFFLRLDEQEIDDIVAFLEAISVDPTGVPPDCGDGVVDADEECDDGNLDDADGCSLQCQQEEGSQCSGEPSVCEPICDDGGWTAYRNRLLFDAEFGHALLKRDVDRYACFRQPVKVALQLRFNYSA